jgi:hypothetical protein
MSRLKKLNRAVMLYVAGLGCLTAAAFTFAIWAGLVAAGVSLLALGWETSE